jgi:hypothetical protein
MGGDRRSRPAAGAGAAVPAGGHGFAAAGPCAWAATAAPLACAGAAWLALRGAPGAGTPALAGLILAAALAIRPGLAAVASTQDESPADATGAALARLYPSQLAAAVLALAGPLPILATGMAGEAGGAGAMARPLAAVLLAGVAGGLAGEWLLAPALLFLVRPRPR